MHYPHRSFQDFNAAMPSEVPPSLRRTPAFLGIPKHNSICKDSPGDQEAACGSSEVIMPPNEDGITGVCLLWQLSPCLWLAVPCFCDFTSLF